VPKNQHDYLTSAKMINTLLRSGIKIQKADRDFTSDSKLYKKGSYIISLAQPKMGLIRNLLIETHYPDNYWTRNKNNTPLRPYDLATHTMAEFMGVKVDILNMGLTEDFPILQGQDKIEGTVERGNAGYRIDGRLNTAFRAVNLLLNEGITIKRSDSQNNLLKPGDFIIEKAPEEKLRPIAKETGISFNPLDDLEDNGLHAVKRGRTGLFQRYYGGNMDEGWTRLCLENFNFDYQTLRSDEIKEGNLNDKFEVIILPNDSKENITGDYKEGSRIDPEDYPLKYRSGIGEKGIEALKEFVSKGGTLVTFGNSYEFAVEAFDLQIRNVTENLSSTSLFCPGSTLKADFNNTNPLAYGMPENGLVLNYSSPAFAVIPGKHNDQYTTIVRYQDKNLLKSGWLIGEEKIAGKPVMLTADYENGEIVLIGFRVQHRDQTDGTFKLLFNTIIR
jgi:hypothetical protein